VPFYEIIYETGSKSVAFAETDEEMSRGLTDHHNRAKSGFPGGPPNPDGRFIPAERIAAVEVYDRHPAEYGAEQASSKDVMLKTTQELIEKLADENGIVHTHQLTQALIENDTAIKPLDQQERLESQFKMQSVRSLKPSLWGEK
jgi:hypothetical protein